MGKMIVISGASGVGKGTVLNLMMGKRKDLTFSVSATTRPPRPNEVDGVHYYFVTRETFEEMIRNGEFLEYDEHAKNYYGTPRAQAQEKMENGNLPLEDTLKCYEEGIRLSRELNASLTDAEKRMLELAGGELLPMEDAP